MPIYEYRCQPCDHHFETLLRSSRDVARCPQCGETDHLVKQFSVPAAAQVGGSRSSLPLCDPGSGPSGCGAGACGTGLCDLD